MNRNGVNKNLHLFWGKSRNLSWLRLQTVITFAKQNPNWDIIVWYRENETKQPAWTSKEQSVQYTGKCYFKELDKIKNVQLRKPPFDLEISDVHFSDYLRWWLLYTYGGFWSDFDIVYIRPMDTIPLSNGPFLIRYPSAEWPIGFLGSYDKEGREFFGEVMEQAEKSLFSLNGYQDIGCILLEHMAKKYKKNQNSKLWVYPEYKLARVKAAYFDENSGYRIANQFIGAHWYAGASWATEFENSLNPENPSQEHLSAGIMRAIQGVLA